MLIDPFGLNGNTKGSFSGKEELLELQKKLINDTLNNEVIPEFEKAVADGSQESIDRFNVAHDKLESEQKVYAEMLKLDDVEGYYYSSTSILKQHGEFCWLYSELSRFGYINDSNYTISEANDFIRTYTDNKESGLYKYLHNVQFDDDNNWQTYVPNIGSITSISNDPKGLKSALTNGPIYATRNGNHTIVITGIIMQGKNSFVIYNKNDGTQRIESYSKFIKNTDSYSKSTDTNWGWNFA